MSRQSRALQDLTLLPQIREHRVARGWTQTELATKAGLSLGTIWKLETLEDFDVLGRIHLGTLWALAEALSVRPVDLYPELKVKP